MKRIIPLLLVLVGISSPARADLHLTKQMINDNDVWWFLQTRVFNFSGDSVDLTDEQLQKFTDFDAYMETPTMSTKSFRNLSGLKVFPYLKSIDIWDSYFSGAYTIADFPALEKIELMLKSNSLTITNCPKLQEIIKRSEGDLKVTGCDNVETVECGYRETLYTNSIADVSTCGKLNKLVNYGYAVDASSAQNLNYLEMYGPSSEVKLGSKAAVETLKVEDADISKIDAPGEWNLTSVNIQNCTLPFINLSPSCVASQNPLSSNCSGQVRKDKTTGQYYIDFADQVKAGMHLDKVTSSIGCYFNDDKLILTSYPALYFYKASDTVDLIVAVKKNWQDEVTLPSNEIKKPEYIDQYFVDDDTLMLEWYQEGLETYNAAGELRYSLDNEGYTIYPAGTHNYQLSFTYNKLPGFSINPANPDIEPGYEAYDLTKGKIYRLPITRAQTLYNKNIAIAGFNLSIITGSTLNAGQIETVMGEYALYTLMSFPTGVEELENGQPSEAEYFTLDGRSLGSNRPTALGLYLRHTGSSTAKVLIR